MNALRFPLACRFILPQQRCCNCGSIVGRQMLELEAPVPSAGLPDRARRIAGRADVRPPAHAVSAIPAGRREDGDDMIAFLEVRHARPDLPNDAGTFMPNDDG